MLHSKRELQNEGWKTLSYLLEREEEGIVSLEEINGANAHVHDFLDENTRSLERRHVYVPATSRRKVTKDSRNTSQASLESVNEAILSGHDN